jgi:hypothetical protein
MATEVRIMKKGNSLVACDPISQDSIDAMKQGEIVSATFRRPRKIAFHNLFFLLMSEVYHNQTRWATMDDMLDVIKIGVGLYVERYDINGNPYPKPLSISFGAMDEPRFEQFYNKVVEFICRKILPGVTDEQLKQRISDIMGEAA